MSFWENVERKRAALGMSRAEMSRRAGISESTVFNGVKRKSRPTGAVRRQLELVLALEEQVQKDEGAAVGSRQSADGRAA